jgi:transposase-like protein
MSAPRKFDDETRERAVRLYQDRLREHGESKLAPRRHVGALPGINQSTIRNWVRAEESGSGSGKSSPESGARTADAQEELRQLRAENAELRRANDIPRVIHRAVSAAVLGHQGQLDQTRNRTTRAYTASASSNSASPRAVNEA